MSVKHIFSIQESGEKAVEDIKKQLNGFDAKMLIFFASSNFNHEYICSQMKDAFNCCEIFGCSTAGEIVSGKILTNSVVVMAFDSETIDDVKIEIIEDMKADILIKKAFKSFEKYYNEPADLMDITKYVGIVLMDGLSLLEERVMDKIGDLTNVTFVGGAASDDLKFEKTYISANGKTYTNAALLALIKPRNGFEVIKTQSFRALDKKLVATKANEETREVIEFNNKPATEAYAQALGVSINELKKHFVSNPVGLVVDGDIYVRSPQQIKDSRIIFYCNILKGMEVSILESTDIIEDTKAAVADVKNKLENISALINFNCVIRTLELQHKGLTEQYGKIFSDIPTIGFSTYGEEYVGHINQTATMVAFK